MAIFKKLLGKKTTKDGDKCCDIRIAREPSCNREASSSADNETLTVKVMGTGCKKCHQLHENALEAAERSDKAVSVEYVTDIVEIAAAGIISTPALLIDNKVISTGTVLSSDEIEKMLR